MQPTFVTVYNIIDINAADEKVLFNTRVQHTELCNIYMIGILCFIFLNLSVEASAGGPKETEYIYQPRCSFNPEFDLILFFMFIKNVYSTRYQST